MVRDDSGRMIGHAGGAAARSADRRSSRITDPHPPGVPLDELTVAAADPALHCVVTTADRVGRLAARAPLRRLGWDRRTSVRFHIDGGVITVVADPSSASSITMQGHLRLPLAVRRRSRLAAGARLLLVAWPDSGTLVVCTMAVVEQMILAGSTAVADAARGRS
ncbi:hypothetical protein [Pseudonocardia hydrocarbonoxydans]|uniref:hypothetical protein n=1 Tax=Pseudonocardia hydrocarbonoxydans TaxID=76726 RepID=UPI0031D19F61